MTTQSAPRTSTLEERSRRWDEEARFFDHLAADVDESTLFIDPLALQRYSRPVLRKRFNKEFRFRLLGPLEGKTLLDIGCGDGLNSVMFAKMGARVTGLDISPGAIDVARRRAELNGVLERMRFICAPAEIADLAPGFFRHHLGRRNPCIMSLATLRWCCNISRARACMRDERS